jgi:hypothetical protein
MKLEVIPPPYDKPMKTPGYIYWYIIRYTNTKDQAYEDISPYMLFVFSVSPGKFYRCVVGAVNVLAVAHV